MANGGVEYAAGLVAAQHFDRAELAAHGADFFGLVVFAAFFKHLRVKGGLVHGFPVQCLAGGVHGCLAGNGGGAAKGHFAHMGSHA